MKDWIVKQLWALLKKLDPKNKAFSKDDFHVVHHTSRVVDYRSTMNLGALRGYEPKQVQEMKEAMIHKALMEIIDKIIINRHLEVFEYNRYTTHGDSDGGIEVIIKVAEPVRIDKLEPRDGRKRIV